MKRRALLFSGRSGSGKSAVAERISRKFAFELIDAFQAIEAQLDSEGLFRPTPTPEPSTRPELLVKFLNERVVRDGNQQSVVVDCVWDPAQVHEMRRSSSGWSVIHVHLQAPEDVCTERRAPTRTEGARDVKRIDSQSRSDELCALADLVIDTHQCLCDDVVVRVAARLEERPILSHPLIDVFVGGQYGSEGKGNIVQYLAPEYDVLVRVGGPNAGHKVFREGQPPFTFRQLPSGTLARKEDAKLVIGAGAVIRLGLLQDEINKLDISVEDLLIDPQAMIIEDQDKELEERTLKNQIGSTAQGTGAATARKILNRQVGSDVRLARDVEALKHYIQDTVEFFAECLSARKRIMLEGTQGTSLSLHHGFYPHVTSRVTTAAACLAEAGLSMRHVRRTVIVCRTYPIRVGNSLTGETSGPMSLEIPKEEIAARASISVEELDRVEKGSVSGRPRRFSEFDWVQLRRTALLNGPTDVALTFADYLGIENRKAYRYEQLTPATLRFIEELEKVVGVPVSLISTDFSARNIIDRRAW